MLKSKSVKIGMLLILIYQLAFIATAYSQSCFELYDQMFENGGDTLSYEEFHQRELAFLVDIEGCKPPDFSVTTLDGEEIILSSLCDKVVVLNFWFTTCMPCLKEIPLLNNLTTQFDGDAVVFIALARDDADKLNAFFKRFGSFDYKIVPQSFDIASAYKVVGWPQSMVINRNGKVYRSWAGGHASVELLVKDIQQAINDCL